MTASNTSPKLAMWTPKPSRRLIHASCTPLRSTPSKFKPMRLLSWYVFSAWPTWKQCRAEVVVKVGTAPSNSKLPNPGFCEMSAIVNVSFNCCATGCRAKMFNHVLHRACAGHKMPFISRTWTYFNLSRLRYTPLLVSHVLQHPDAPCAMQAILATMPTLACVHPAQDHWIHRAAACHIVTRDCNQFCQLHVSWVLPYP